MSRRGFLAGVAGGALAGGRTLFALQSAAPAVDATDLRARIEALSLFGRPPAGTFASGVTRVAYSDADLAGRSYVLELMRAAGVTPRIDPAGNIFAKRPGTDASLRP
ncbi:MAG: hypothetical protein M3478_07925, partial [Planctomycetota bacterium]|nr:hypothetical protein [Planctomycetota bacterium]